MSSADTLEESSIEALSDFKDFLFAWGFLQSDFDVRSWIDPRPLARAQKSLALKPTKNRDAIAARVL